MYYVSASVGREMNYEKTFKSAKAAIKDWLKGGGKYPYDISIDASTKDEVIAMRRFVKENKEWFYEEHSKTKCPYKVEYLYKDVQEPEKLVGCEYDYDLPMYPVSPFTVG